MKRFRSHPAFPVLVLTVLGLVATPSPAAQYHERLLNISTRARVVGNGSNAVFAGFVVGEGAPKQVLIRAVGPSLSQFGLAANSLLANPLLEVFDSTGTKVLENDNWNTGGTSSIADFDAVGAFRFASLTSQDAAIKATLSPGSYTVKVSAPNATTAGIALVEVYDISGAAPLINLSTRALVQTGTQIVVAGIVVAPGGAPRRILARAAGPSLAPFGLSGLLANPSISIVDSRGFSIANNDNWSDAGNAATISSATSASGAFAFGNGTLDSALVAELQPGSYSIEVSGVGASSGLALVEVYDLTPSTISLVSVVASNPSTDTAGSAPGIFTFIRTGSLTDPLTVIYTLQGTAVGGVDFVNIPGAVTIPAGAASTTLEIKPYANTQTTVNNKAVTLTLVSGSNYEANGSASVTIYANPGTLYIANMRPSSAATGALSSGTASIQLSSDETFALVALNYTNLSSPQTLAYLRLGNPNDAGAAYLFQIPNGQSSGLQWDIRDTPTHTAGDIVQAVKEGRVFVSVDSANFPNGELMGTFLRSSGSAVFNPPPAPPSFNLGTSITPTEASRFLTQATFGPIPSEIDALIAKGFTTWITEQMATPVTSHRAEIMADFAANNAGGTNPDANRINRAPGQQHRIHSWWKISLRAEDQLRQRVAFALSQILVISDQNGTILNWEEGAAHYYDMLANGAFGNFRQLLHDVTLHPMMGIYLSHLRNAKAAGAALPDENYAREVMQLFSIGLNELNPDGTLRLDPQGLPIPTYTQTTISETAKVFTGWGYAQNYATTPTFRGGGGIRPDNSAPDYIDTMRLYPASHDDSAKTIVGGRILPAGQGGVEDLNDTLDALFNHPNTGPFISRLLIQRLVASNPSPGYVYRVAQKFTNNGAGVRGDLGAVVRAILTDYEARSPAVAVNPAYGKLKEPILRTTALFRAFNAASNVGRYNTLNNSNGQIAQMPLSAPTVFNFFEPNYVQPGMLAAAGLYAPEYQIFTDTTAITLPNYLYTYLYRNRPAATTDTNVYLDVSSLLPLAATPTALVDRLDLLLGAGNTTPEARARIASAITSMPTGTADTEKVRSAAYLLISTPEGAIQN